MKGLFLILPMIFAWGSANHNIPQYHKDTDRVVNEHVKYVQTTYGISPCIRGGGYRDKVNSISVGFMAKKAPMDVAGARKLIVALSEDLLKRINGTEEIRAHLVEFPYPAEDLNYTIYFKDQNGEFARNAGDSKDPNNLYWVISKGGTVVYGIANDMTKGKLPISVHKEPYTEALKIVQQAQ